MEEVENKSEEIVEEQLKAGLLEKLKLHKFKILGGILGVFVFAGAVFGVYEFGYKRGQLEQSRRSALKIDCQSDLDCVLAVYKNDCCVCPFPVNRVELGRNKNLTEYLPNKKKEILDKLPKCKNIACSPCAWSSKAVCESGICKGTSKEETKSPEKIYCKDPRPEVCTMECIVNPPYICGSDGKSYCSECQACSNPEVEWCVIQDKPCEVK